MTRRSLLTKSLLCATAPALLKGFPLPGKSSRIDRSRISAISDEIAMSPEESIAFAHHFELRWLELRGVPGLPGENKAFYFLPEPELQRHAKLFKDGGIKISFINTNLLKKGLPGTTLVSKRPKSPEMLAKDAASAQQEYDQRFDNLAKCIRSAHAFDCPYLRVFTFLRVEQPEAIYDRVANVIGEMAEKAKKEGVLLLVENEASCNVGSSAEMAALLSKIPENLAGFNWDARNALTLNENPFPEGYKLLPKHRMRNAQIKGHDILDEQKPIDWAPIFAAMDEDGFTGNIGLETHYFDGTKLERSHLAMDKIVKLADANASRT